MLAAPVVVAENVEEHVAMPVVALGDSVQIVKDPVTPVSMKLTVPLGVIAVPGEVSVTVAMHVEDAPMLIVVGLHEMDVDVVRSVTVIVVVLELGAWFVSPRKEAVRIWVPVPIAVGV